MAQESRPRILIRTLPLTNGNYGGVLQAYALQVVLRELGADPFTDASRADRAGDIVSATRLRVKRLAGRAALLEQFVPSVWQSEAIRRMLAGPTDAFAEQMIRQVRVFRNGRPDVELVRSFDLFIAGSDQVWRAKYGSVPSYLFDFIQDPGARLFSYAASFGVDNTDEYDADLKALCGKLARRFSAISVREEHGVAICRDEWQVSAERHVDPTLLLSPEHYTRLALRSRAPDESVDSRSGHRLLTYILDDSPEVEGVVSTIESALSTLRHDLMPATPDSIRQMVADPARYRRPTVAQWLESFRTSHFIVTDSFHGAAFAIMHNRPFIVVPNPRRGVSRLTSMLTLFGLEDRIVQARDGSAVTEILERQVAWDPVNIRLDRERARGRAFLAKAIS